MRKVRLLSVTVAALLTSALAGGVLAQTPEPIERTPEMEQRAAELGALIPESLGGVSLSENLQTSVGQELIADLDPSDPDHARDIEQLDEMAASVGATLDDAATATSFAQLTEDAYAWVIAYQIRDTDISPVLPLFVAAFEEDIPNAIVEESQVGDQPVTVLSSGDDPAGGSYVILPRGDVLWLISVPPEFLEEAIEALPEA